MTVMTLHLTCLPVLLAYCLRSKYLLHIMSKGGGGSFCGEVAGRR